MNVPAKGQGADRRCSGKNGGTGTIIASQPGTYRQSH